MNIANLLATKGRPVVTVRSAQSVKEAVTRLAEERVSALVVVDEGRRPIGIITERHVVRRLATDDQVLRRTVGEIMVAELVTATPHDELTWILDVMRQRRIRHIPVIDRDELVGIVSFGDVMRFQRDQYRGRADTLEATVMASEG